MNHLRHLLWKNLLSPKEFAEEPVKYFSRCLSVLNSNTFMASHVNEAQAVANDEDSNNIKRRSEQSPLKPAVNSCDAGPPSKISRKEKHEDKAAFEKDPQMSGQRRRKFAVLLAYCGSGYFGMQRQPGQPTIEECVLEALFKSKLIGGDVLANPSLAANFQRAARTDKGVSAACQLISLYMAERIGPGPSPTAPEEIVKAINEHLPEQIRTIGVWRVTRGFDSKSFCCARTYCYMLPTYAFQECSEVIQPDTKSYRIDPSKIDAINAFLQHYKGTHNFHNFTSGLSAEDRSANRYMLSLECSKPFLGVDEKNLENTLEFVTISIKGQSFMLHQIRKMLALMISVIRGSCSMDTLGKAWGPDRVDIPMAPALGLFLYRLHFDVYNKRYGSDGMHEPLEWSKVDDVLESFKERHITGHIIRTEIADKAMLTWLATLNRHSFDYARLRPDNNPENCDKEPVPETNEGIAAQLVAEINSV